MLPVFILLSCTTDIQKINDNIAEYTNKKVTIKGQVVSTTNALFFKYYKVRDSSGEIFVTTENKLPEENQKIKVTGTVRQFIKIGDIQVSAIEEDEQK